MPTVFSSSILEGYEGHLSAIRAIAATENGRWVATGDIGGKVIVSLDGQPLYETDMRPLNYKANADRFLNRLAFSRTGDLLYACSGVDVVAINATTGRIAWEFAPKRSFGFLKTNPLGLAVTVHDNVIISCSNGEFVLLDRKGRQLQSEYENDAAQSLVSVADQPFVVGTDGYKLLAWDAETLKVSREILTRGRFYSLSASTKMPLIAVRVSNQHRLYNYLTEEWTVDVPCQAGLPVSALSPYGERIAFIEDGLPTIVDIDSGLRKRLEKTATHAVTVAWMFREEKFGFGFADGSLKMFDYHDL